MNKPKQRTGFFTALGSIMAAAIGIQKRENMERDLNANNPIIFVVAGIVFLILFISSLLLVVNLVTP